MIDNGAPPAEDWTWMQATGYAMMCRQVPARSPIETSNRFAAMESDEPEVPDPPEPIEGTLPRAGKLAGLPSAPRPTLGTRKSPCCTRTCLGLRACGRRDDQVPDSVPESDSAAPSLKTFIEMRAQSLRPLSNEWEKLTAILDSGASVIVVPPHVMRSQEAMQPQLACGMKLQMAMKSKIWARNSCQS